MLPMPATEANREMLRRNILELYAQSTFNTPPVLAKDAGSTASPHVRRRRNASGPSHPHPGDVCDLPGGINSVLAGHVG